MCSESSNIAVGCCSPRPGITSCTAIGSVRAFPDKIQRCLSFVLMSIDASEQFKSSLAKGVYDQGCGGLKIVGYTAPVREMHHALISARIGPSPVVRCSRRYRLSGEFQGRRARRGMTSGTTKSFRRDVSCRADMHIYINIYISRRIFQR